MLRGLKLSRRLYGGFAILILLLVGAVSTTLWQVNDIESDSVRTDTVTTPTALPSMSLTASLEGRLAALRVFVLTGNNVFKAERAADWKTLDAASKTMDEISSSWTNPDNVRPWSE